MYSSIDPTTVVITQEELDCFPRCLFQDASEPDPALHVPGAGPWVAPDWGTRECEEFEIKVKKARVWWAGKGTPPNPPPDDESYEQARQKLDQGLATPVEVTLPPDPEEQHKKVEPPASAGPTGGGDYTVQPGDCLASIAFAHGVNWDAVWNDPANAEVKQRRGHPNLLLPGDRLKLPQIQPRKEPAAIDQSHRFRLKNTPAKLNLRLRWGGQPRAGERYELSVAGKVISGALGSDGDLSEWITPDATDASLKVGEGPRLTELKLQLGQLQPIASIAGVQSRLANLGYYSGEATGEWSEATQRAIRAFQRDQQLDSSGELNDQTRSRLLTLHDRIQ